jgi:hypothetical protein
LHPVLSFSAQVALSLLFQASSSAAAKKMHYNSFSHTLYISGKQFIMKAPRYRSAFIIFKIAHF